jgi:hypothetical protein
MVLDRWIPENAPLSGPVAVLDDVTKLLHFFYKTVGDFHFPSEVANFLLRVDTTFLEYPLLLPRVDYLCTLLCCNSYNYNLVYVVEVLYSWSKLLSYQDHQYNNCSGNDGVYSTIISRAFYLPLIESCALLSAHSRRT